MKKSIYITFLSLALTTLSCQQFLEEDPRGRLTPASLYQDLAGLDMALTGLYAEYIQTNRYVFRSIHTWVGDDVTAQDAGNKTRFAEYDRFNFNSGNTEILNQYLYYYRSIKAANNIIKNAVGMNIEKEALDQRLGQAYFIRAINYFMLVRIWGRVPLVKEVEIDYTTPKAEVAAIYDLILEDVLKAEAMLPEKHKVAPYFRNNINIAPNKGAAKALLASVYMTMAGWPLKKGAEYYNMAAAKYKEIIDHEADYGYILEPDVRTLVREPESNYSKEIVFGEFHNVSAGNDTYAGPLLPSCPKSLAVGAICWQSWNFSKIFRRAPAKTLIS